MGMYDIVNYSMECPTCGQIVDGFQTKSGERVLNVLEFWEATNFYSFCESCGTWIEFDRILKPCPIEEYKMTVTSKEERIRNREYQGIPHDK